MQVVFNNIRVRTTVSNLYSFLEEQNLSESPGIAVAVNEVIIPSKDWSTSILRENDNILVITATQGG